MKRFLNSLRRTLPTRPASARGRHTFRPQLEQLGQRLLPSLSSAIDIQHHSALEDWTERDCFTAVQSTGFIVEFKGTNRYNIDLGIATAYALAVSATIDPLTGTGAVFMLRNDQEIWYCDSNLKWNYEGYGPWSALSATRDGHVYAVTADGSSVHLIASNELGNFGGEGDALILGAPNTSKGAAVQTGRNSVAASVGWFGGNEVFAIGQDGAIYVNSSNTYGDWRLVDNRAYFVSLSATPNNTVFAVTIDGRLFQETEGYRWIGGSAYFYWFGRDISAGRSYTGNISADTDTSGRDEVYAITNVTNELYLYDLGSWTYKDGDVFDVSAAGGGYFYDVNYHSGNYDAYQYDPTSWWFPWTYLGSNFS